MGSVDVVVSGLARLVRPLMVTCMGCLIVVVLCSAILTRSVVFSKQVLMSKCLEAERSYSGTGLGGKISRVLANNPTQHLVKYLAWGVWLREFKSKRKEVFGGVYL
jgi:hypothetical protein